MGELMFTGIIEKKGKVLSNLQYNEANRLAIVSDYEHLHVGESISVNGVCLTLLPSESGHLRFDVSPETLQRTNLATLGIGDAVNLERAMLASTRFGGHYVTGHIDTVVQARNIKFINQYVEFELSGFSAQEMLYLVPKGSITVNGVSLTINEVNVSEQYIKLMLVPHTLSVTTFDALSAGQLVNIEFDYLTRTVAHQLEVAGMLKMI